jgi:4-amino-4-deoxy-L-arabinose transferase-like glycosyltransferase
MTSTETPARVSRIALPVLLALAFLVRLGVRLAFGETGFRANGYTAYYDLARNIVAGKGFCFETACAEWPPLYPAFLALMALWGKHWLLIVVPQALMGAATAGLAFLIGREMFNPLTGLIACAITALYPYYVMHDTAIQESGMRTFCAAAAVWLLLRATRVNRNADWFYAGLSLGSIA